MHESADHSATLQVQVRPSHYDADYDSLDRFMSYWHQVSEASVLGGRILEVGVGSGAVSAILRARGFEVVTLDFDEDLAPDVVADIRRMPIDIGAFDGAMACEVLEHLPWEDVPRALAELRRVVSRWALISVPISSPAIAVQGLVPNASHILRMAARRRWSVRDSLWALSQGAAWRRRGGRVSRMAAIESLREHAHEFDGQHYWMLDKGGVGAPQFRELIEQAGFVVSRDFRPVQAPWHHFFVLAVAAAPRS